MSELKVSIDYFNDEHKGLFQAYPNVTVIDALVQNGSTISKEEFLGYMMFKDQLDADGHRNFGDLSLRIQHRLGDIDDFLTFNNNSVQARFIGADLHQTGLTERIGISLGLCILNQIHGLTRADWTKIPEAPGRNGHPTFDFAISLASTGSNFIQAENKGSALKQNTDQGGTIAIHYKSILRKKKHLRSKESEQEISQHQNLYYGTIGVVDNQPNSVAKVWLIDPPAFEVDMDPRKYKLISRLTYYLEEFKQLKLRPKILEALEVRINEIYVSKNYSTFDNKSIDGNYPAKENPSMYMDTSNSFALVDTNEAFGRIFLIERKQRTVPYLIAFPKALIRIIIKQNFEQILDYKYEPDFMKESVQVLMRFSKSEMVEKNISKVLKFTFNEKKGLSEAIYFGRVNFTSDGKIFGVLDIEQQRDDVDEQ